MMGANQEKELVGSDLFVGFGRCGPLGYRLHAPKIGGAEPSPGVVYLPKRA